MGVVQKYGGSSVATPEKILKVAQCVAKVYKSGTPVVVVASAMGKTTDRLIALSKEVNPSPDPRELDALLATGEQQTVSLLAMALEGMGVPARSFASFQCGLKTSRTHTRARIKDVDPSRLNECLATGAVPVVVGFQGVDEDGNITTLGRGGSDTTAVALAAALGWQCEIYTDVDGLYSVDPRKYPTARKLAYTTFEEMMEMASMGAGVLETRSVELAKKYSVPLYLGRTGEEEKKGTWIVEKTNFENMPVTGLSIDGECALITVKGPADSSSFVSDIFKTISEMEINVDMISQQLSEGQTVLTFSCKSTEAQAFAERYPSSVVTEGQTKLSLVGVGMITHSGITYRAFSALRKAGISWHQVTTSEISISLTVDRQNEAAAITALADEFELGEQ